MSSTSARHASATRRRTLRRRLGAARCVFRRYAALGVAVAAALAAGALIAVDDGLAQPADSEASASDLRVAAVGGEATGQPGGVGAGTMQRAIDLRVLLAQNASTTAAGEAQSRDDNTLLVSFAISTPRGTEDDVAKQHGLVVVGRWDLVKFDLRVVKVRIPPGRSAAGLITDLQVDARVKSVQASVMYRPAVAADPRKGEPGESLKVKPNDGSQTPASPPRRYGIAAALDTASQQKAGQSAVRGPKPSGPLAAASTSASVQWLKDDEPFVGADGRLR